MKNLPDFEINLREATEFLMSTELARKAFRESFLPEFPNIFRDLIESIHLMAKSCHLPEFTEHGLPHICSVVKRISDWGENIGWLDRLKEKEATILLMAAIVHDIGMLSQNREDLEDTESFIASKEMMEIPVWVRKTHGLRIKGVLKKVILNQYIDNNIESDRIYMIAEVAKAHNYWPEEYEEKLDLDLIRSFFDKDEMNRAFALSSIISIADLLDEDGERCDTITLLQHRQGTIENKAHWIRHSLVHKRIDIKKDRLGNNSIEVFFAKPEGNINKVKMCSFYQVLQRHIELIYKYNSFLSIFGAEIPEGSIIFNPKINCCDDLDEIEYKIDVGQWEDNIDLRNTLPELLINTLFLNKINKSNINLDFYNQFINSDSGPTTIEEKIFYSKLEDY